MTVVHVNGKFTARRTTGVERVAHNLVHAVDALLDRQPAGTQRARWVLWCPPGAQLPALRQIEVRTTGSRAFGLHAWEQVWLPRAASGGVLLNLGGSAPWRVHRQVCTVFDAALFDVPAAYRSAFRWWYRALFRHLVRRAEALITVSAFSRERLSTRLGVPKSRFELIPCGGDHLDRCAADHRVIDTLGLRGQRYLLAVASANPTKNLATLARAFASLSDADLRLVIVGGGNASVFGPSAAEPEGVDDRVVRAGVVDDAQLKSLYQHAAGLVFPSLYEGFGLPPLEAMACGCPVIVARAASMPEVCADAALYVDPKSPGAMTEAMHHLLDDADLRQRLIDAGRRRVATFTWEASARRLLGLVQR